MDEIFCSDFGKDVQDELSFGVGYIVLGDELVRVDAKISRGIDGIIHIIR